MTQYQVTGMSCAACSARVEKAVNSVPGVTGCAVSLLTNSMGVEGSAAPEAVIAAVEAAGYGASLKSNAQKKTSSADAALADTETPALLRRLCVSVVFLLILMYFSMGHMMWGWPLPAFYEGNHLAMGLTQLLLTVIVMIINQKFFISGYKALLHRAPNMDTLVALGSSAAFVYSTYVLFAMTGAVTHGDTAATEHYMMEFYFESAAMILTLITVGKTLEARAKGKTTDALRSLMKLMPDEATVLRGDKEISVPVAEVQIGDIFVVRPGETIPVDGTVEDGVSAVDEAALTGESVPVDKEPGSTVSAGTMNTSGFLRCRAARVGEDTALSEIIRLVSDTAATKAPIAKIADKVSGIFVPTVLAIALVTTVVWLLVRGDLGYALARGISVLVISCPCALGLATPVAIMVGSGVGARNGILFKTAASLEQTGKTRTVVLDKTGTVTLGTPVVADLCPAPGVDEDTLLSAALALESKSEHPLARAILAKAEERGMTAEDVDIFSILSGSGLSAEYHGAHLTGGNAALIEKTVTLPDSVRAQAEQFAKEGKTPLFFAHGGRYLGMIATVDKIKEDSPAAIAALKNMGIRVVMLTGDNALTAAAVAKETGVDEVIAGVLPEGKEAVVRRFQADGPVAMVGDGINDAPALTRADVGMAIGTGTDVAVDAADLVLMHASLSDVAAAIRLSRATLTNIHENLFWAFFYNTIGIPVAAGVFVSLGLTLDPMFGAAAMSLSSFCVVSNALRLNLCRVHDAGHDHKLKPKKKKEKKTMEITMKIDGMMCVRCEAHVKKALEAIPGVTEAIPSHDNGTAVVKTNAAVSDEALTAAVVDAGYDVLGIVR